MLGDPPKNGARLLERLTKPGRALRRTAAASESLMLRFGLWCVLTYFKYAPPAPRPLPTHARLTKPEFAAVLGIVLRAKVWTWRDRSRAMLGVTADRYRPNFV